MQIKIYFSCLNRACGLIYSATQQEHADQRSGSFRCEDCQTLVHRWFGAHDYAGWKEVFRKL
jgi:hypothetical protein